MTTEASRGEFEALHQQIMSLPWGAPSDCMTPTERMGYSAGHRDARHAAAELVSAASAGRTELLEALKELESSVENPILQSRIRSLISKHTPSPLATRPADQQD